MEIQQKIEELRSKAGLGSEGSFENICKEMDRFMFNRLYFREATNEVEPWGTKEQQDDQQNFANGWNAYREDVKEVAIKLGIIKESL